MGIPIVHWEINTQAFDRVVDFYRMLFGWSINVFPEMEYGLVNTGSKKGIDGGIGKTKPGAANFVTFYMEVDNIQEYLDKAVSLGATVVTPVTEIPNMVTFAQFRDPDGNLVGLVKSEAAPPKKKTTRKKKAGVRRAQGRRTSRR